MLPTSSAQERHVPADRRIFLSYAWLDNDKPALAKDAAGWVSYLYDQLIHALRPKLGGAVDFWRDTVKIDRNEAFERAIDEAIRDSLLLLAIVSESYLDSDWCSYERSRFLAHNPQPADLPPENIVKILKHSMDEGLLPAALRGREGYRFFAVDQSNGDELAYYFNGKLRPGREDLYIEEVERLANYLLRTLRQCAPAQPGGGKTIFIAPAQGADTDSPFVRVQRALKGANVRLSTPAGGPPTEQDLRAALRDSLEDAAMAVHIIGQGGGQMLRDSQSRVVALELDETGRWADSHPGFVRCILVLATHGNGDDGHRALVHSLGIDLDQGGRLRDNDQVILEGVGGQTVQDFIDTVLERAGS